MYGITIACVPQGKGGQPEPVRFDVDEPRLSRAIPAALAEARAMRLEPQRILSAVRPAPERNLRIAERNVSNR
jgi:hypothetical protein